MRLVYEHLTDIPSNFTEVEYLESSGTQYIDTGVLPVNDMEFECKFTFTSLVNTNLTIVGSRDGEKRCQPIGVYNNKWSASIGGSYDANGTAVSANTPYIIKSTITNGQTITTNVNGSQASTCTSTTGLPSQELYIFARNFYGNPDPADSKVNGRLYLLKIKANGGLVRDFVPCLDNNNIPCLYDKVEGKAYYNAGTGSFTYGRKIIPVEYLESTGTQYINTGVNANSNPKYELKFVISYTNPSSPSPQYTGADYGGTFGVVNGNWQWSNNVPVTANQFYEIDYINQNGSRGAYVNGTDYYQGSNYSSFGYMCLLFTSGQDSSGATKTNLFSAKMKSCSIALSDTIVRDFIPCKDENNVGFMFDRVTHTAYLNSGTGSFITGSVKPKKKLRLIRDSKRRLPKNFREVEYLESTGTQYIKTGVMPTNTHGIDINFSFSSDEAFNTSWVPIGARTGDNRFWINKSVETSGMSFGWGGVVSSFLKQPKNTILHTSLNLYNDRKRIYSNQNYSSNIDTNLATLSNQIYLFGGNLNSSLAVQPPDCKIYRAQITKGSSLVRDFIPCLDNNNTPCMYDLVEGKAYYNAGTGSFSYGHTITPVEYLESSGTQYIDTGISTAEGICAEVKFKLNSITSTSQVVFGKVGSTTPPMSRYWFGAQGSSLKWYYAVNEYITTSANADADIHTVVLDTVNNVCTLDGETIATFGNLNSNSETISLFSVFYQGSLNNPMSGRIYYTKILNNGTLVRDFIPCKDENNVGYMFDKVTHSLYANAGTGAFVVGNEIKQDITRFVKDDIPNIYRKVSYLQSSGTQYIDTGYVPNNNTTIKFNIQLTSTSINWAMITGRRSIIGTYTFFYMQFTNSQYFSNSALWFVIGPQANITALAYPNPLNEHVITISVPEQKIIVDGNTTSFSGSIQSGNNYPLNVFASINANGSVSTGQPLKLYYYKIWDNGTLVRDFIPVVRKSDNKPGMYDRVTKQFFTNTGTGEFIIPT